MGTIFNYEGARNKSQSDLRAFEQAASIIDIHPNWLGAVFQLESNWNPKAVNPNSGATGVIQFMPSTARNLGTSTTALYNMTFQQQLKYVIKYFGEKAGLRSLEDTYLKVFYPKAIGKPMNWTVATEGDGSKIFEQNAGFYSGNKDSEGRKVILVSDITNSIRSKYRAGERAGEILISPPLSQ